MWLVNKWQFVNMRPNFLLWHTVREIFLPHHPDIFPAYYRFISWKRWPRNKNLNILASQVVYRKVTRNLTFTYTVVCHLRLYLTFNPLYFLHFRSSISDNLVAFICLPHKFEYVLTPLLLSMQNLLQHFNHQTHILIVVGGNEEGERRHYLWIGWNLPFLFA